MDGKHFSRANLEEMYKPWIELAKQGIVGCTVANAAAGGRHHMMYSWHGLVMCLTFFLKTTSGTGYGTLLVILVFWIQEEPMWLMKIGTGISWIKNF